MVEKLGDVPGAATCSEMFAVGGGVYGAVEQDMHNDLDRHAAWAGHLFLNVLGEKTLCV
jgi:hypothetical protein